MDFSTISDIVVAVSALVAALVVSTAAFYGLQTWRNELRGKARFDAARRVLLLSRKVGDQFRMARSPFTFAAVGRRRSPEESDREAQVLDDWLARQQRLEPLRETIFVELQEAGWDAEILLGGDAGDRVAGATKEFRNVFGDVASAVDSYFREKLRRADGVEGGVDQKWLDGLEAKFHGRPSGDALSERIENAIDELSKGLKTFL